MLVEYMKNMQCFNCDGYKDGCYEEPKGNVSEVELGEEDARCFYFHTLREAVANMTSREKSQVQVNANRELNDGLEKLFKGNPASNKRLENRHIEVSDIRAIVSA